jgi:SnoaL-like domain
VPARGEVERLIAAVERREYLEAIAEFYAPHATMQENLNPPRVGLDALLENERKMLQGFFAEPPLAKAQSFLIDGDRVAIHWTFDYSDRKGRVGHLDEIAYQLWDGNKIVQERFVFDPSSIFTS